MNKEQVKSIFKSLNERPISYYRIYARLMGSVSGGVLLSQIMYWWAAGNHDKFYKKDSELLTETCLSLREFREAKKKLKQLGFIAITLEGVPATTYYEVQYEKLLAVLTSFNDGVQPSFNDGVQPSFNDGVQTYKDSCSTEITTEITTERKEYSSNGKKEPSELDLWFEEFWKALPPYKKTGKKKCKELVKKMKPDPPTRDKLIRYVVQHWKVKQVMEAKGLHFPDMQDPERVIKNERFNDELPDLEKLKPSNSPPNQQTAIETTYRRREDYEKALARGENAKFNPHILPGGSY